MRICHVVRQFRPSVGGLESFVETLAASLTELGSTNDVLTLDRLFRDRRARLPSSEIINGLQVRRAPMLGHPRFFLPLFEDGALASYNVIHVHGVDGMFDRIARYRRRPGQVLAATSHGLFFHTRWMEPVKKAYLHTATRLAASRYDLLIGNSKSDMTRLRSVSDRAVRVPNGVSPLGEFEAAGRDVLSLGRLAPHKHVERLIVAMAQPEMAGVQLHVVGPQWGVTMLDLARTAERFGIADRVKLHGRVDGRRLAAIARECGLFASASRYEGFGMSLIEAMSVGLVPVVEGNEAFVELMDASDVGAVTDFSRPDVAARAMRAQLDSLDGARRRQAMRYARRFSWSGHARTTLALYRRAGARLLAAA